MSEPKIVNMLRIDKRIKIEYFLILNIKNYSQLDSIKFFSSVLVQPLAIKSDTFIVN